MASWERLAFAVLRGGVKGIPLAGGVIEEVLRVLDDEREAAGREATGVVAARAGAAPARDASAEDEAEVERLAGEAWSSLPEPEQRDLRRTVQALAVEEDPAERRVLARELGERLPRRLLEHAALQRRFTGAAGPPSSGGLTPGATLTGGRFTLVELLGKGGFGTVWRARHRDLGKDVALKVLNADVARDDDARRRFLKEFEAATSFVHKYAVQLQEFGRDTERDVLYFTMALVEGPTLRDVIDREGPLAPARVVRLGAQLLEVLEEAHRAGIVHRDIKPQNLLLTTGRDGQEELRVLDFGIAKAVSSAQRNTSGLTLTGMTVGTLRYMSPEQAQGKKLDGRSDLYAAGVVLYETLSRRLPIEADPEAEDTEQSLIFRLVAAAPAELGRVAPATPPGLRAAVMRALEKSPGDRWPDARAFRAALLAVDTDAPPGSFVSAGRDEAASSDRTGAAPTAPGAAVSGSRAPAGSEPATASHAATGAVAAEASRPAAPARSSARPAGAGRPSRAPLLVPLALVLALGAVVAADLGGVRERLVTAATGTTTGAPSPTAPSSPTGGESTTAPGGVRLVDLSPADGAVVADPVIDVRGRLDPPARATLRVQGVPCPLDAEGRFELARLGLRTGENALAISAEVEGGAAPVEATLRVVVDPDRPTLRLSGPADGAEVLVDRVDVHGAVEDLTLDALLVDGARVPVDGRGAFATAARLGPPGSETTVVVEARDRAGNVTTERRRVRRREPALGVTLTAPEDSAWLGAAVVQVEGRVTGNVAPSDVVVQVGGVVAPVAADGRFSATLRLAEGEHTLEALARAQVGDRPVEARASRRIGVDLSPPGLRVITPELDAWVDPDAVLVSAAVDDAAPWVEVTLNGRPVRVTRERDLEERVRLASGETRLDLVATDAAGHRSSAQVPLRRLPPGTPTWFLALPETARPPLPLPRGVSFGRGEREYFNDKDGSVLVWVPPGSFRMGSAERSNWGPVHEVCFARGLFMGKYEVTWAQYRAFCRATGYKEPPTGYDYMVGGRKLASYTTGARDDEPVSGVTWDDAVAYGRWAGLRLPTESEWEYAARGTDGRAFPWGNEEPGTRRANLGTWRSAEDNARDNRDDADGYLHHAPVGSFPAGASPFGCLDMAGNVYEWCQDWYADRYPEGPVTDPRGPASGELRVLRGGSWLFASFFCRAVVRDWFAPSSVFPYFGFRVARSSEE